MEGALSKDLALKSWMKQGMEFMTKNEEAIYSRYRAFPSDIKRDIEPSAIKEQSQSDDKARRGDRDLSGILK